MSVCLSVCLSLCLSVYLSLSPPSPSLCVSLCSFSGICTIKQTKRRQNYFLHFRDFPVPSSSLSITNRAITQRWRLVISPLAVTDRVVSPRTALVLLSLFFVCPKQCQALPVCLTPKERSDWSNVAVYV